MEQIDLPSSGSVYLDTNCFIYSVEKLDPYASWLVPVWEQAAAGRFLVVTSVLTLLECLVKPMHQGDATIRKIYEELLTESAEVRLLEVDARVAARAAAIRASNKLRTPDSIHAASCLEAGAKLFITNDLQVRTVPDLPVVVLKQLSTDDGGAR